MGAVADGEELWELAVTVPPVTELINELLVKCGHTVVTVKKAPRGWGPSQQGYFVTEPKDDYEAVVADARHWVRAAERKRLLANALDEVLRTYGSDEDDVLPCGHTVERIQNDDVTADEHRRVCLSAEVVDPAEGGVVPGHLSCPECSAQPWRPHDGDCPTLVPVVVAEDGSPASLDELVGDVRG